MTQEALKLALEALGKAKRQIVHANVAPHGCIGDAITAIKAALAQPAKVQGYPDTLDVMSTLRPRTFDDYGNKLPSCPPCNNHCDQGRNCPANKQ